MSQVTGFATNTLILSVHLLIHLFHTVSSLSFDFLSQLLIVKYKVYLKPTYTELFFTCLLSKVKSQKF